MPRTDIASDLQRVELYRKSLLALKVAKRNLRGTTSKPIGSDVTDLKCLTTLP
jgi:hypothetical protein